METICVGVAGCGRITERCHLPALLGLEGVSIRGVADPQPERRRLIATRAGNCQRFPSVREMLAAGGLDATGGEVESLEARSMDEGGAMVRVEMTRARARVEASCYVAYGRPSLERVEVQAGTERFLAHDSSDRLRRGEDRLVYGHEFLDAIGRRVARSPSAMTRSFELQLRHSCDVVRGSARPSPGLADGLAAARMIEMVRCRLAGSPSEKTEGNE